MNSTLGTAGVVLGLAASLFGMGTLAYGLLRHRPQLLPIGRTYAWMTLGGSLLAVFAMQRALVTRDFTVSYVAQVGSPDTPPLFNVAAMWSSLEGSLLLWVLVLSIFTALVAWRFRDRSTDPLVGWAQLTMFAVCVFFFALLLFPANPFERFDPGPAFVPQGPNPLLQNHILMAFHPPILYTGYVGFTVPFAFAVAALATGRLGEGWLLETRRWTLIAWGCLTVGIILGGWWAYEVLGWGGYWAWDPVENASLLPWITGTAYLHSVMVQERRGMLRVWNLSLLCATFSLTILGTFLTRSGVTESVHAFSESDIGHWLIGFFAVIVAVTLGLIGWRGDRLRSPGQIDSPASREGAFLANNVLFASLAFVVLLGTVFPLLIEAINGDEMSVGRPYFDRMSVPLGLALLFLMAVAPALPWRKASGELLSQRLFWPAWAGTGAVVLAVVLGARGLAPLVAFGLAGFAAGAAVRQLVLASRRQGWRGLVGRTNGGMIVHLGVVLVAVAIAASNSYDTERELSMAEGDRVEVAGHTIEYRGRRSVERENKTSEQALVALDGQVHTPSLDLFPGGTAAIGTPSVATSFTEDVYLSLVDLPNGTDPDDKVVLRVIVQPLVVWLWVGGAVMAVGTALAAFPGRRRRDPLSPASAPVPSSATDVPAGADDDPGGPGGPGDRGDGDAGQPGDGADGTDEKVDVEVGV